MMVRIWPVPTYITVQCQMIQCYYPPDTLSVFLGLAMIGFLSAEDYY